MPSLILASASPRRAHLLSEAGVSFRICVARVREHEAEDLPRLTPRRIALFNARLKAREVARRHPGRWVLGADTVVALGWHVFGKPRDLEEAEWMLAHLVGRTHRVITAVCLQKFPGKKREFDVTSRVTFRELEKAAIQRYLRLIHPLDKAGAYAAQEHAGRIIRRVTGSWSNVVGLPMERLLREMAVLT